MGIGIVKNPLLGLLAGVACVGILKEFKALRSQLWAFDTKSLAWYLHRVNNYNTNSWKTNHCKQYDSHPGGIIKN